MGHPVQCGHKIHAEEHDVEASVTQPGHHCLLEESLLRVHDRRDINGHEGFRPHYRGVKEIDNFQGDDKTKVAQDTVPEAAIDKCFTRCGIHGDMGQPQHQADEPLDSTAH